MKVILMAAALFAVPVLHAQTQWQLATGYGVNTFHTRNLVQFANDVDQATQGGLHIDVHPNNTLVKLAEIPKAVESGKVQAGEAIMTSFVGEVPIAGADAVPFVVRTYADARRMWQLQRPLIDAHFKAIGLKALYAVAWPPQGLFSIAPVHSKSDFPGTRMRTYNPTTVRIAQLLGTQPVDVPMVGVHRALSANRLDSMITSALTGVENEVWGKIKYYYDINAWFPKNIVFVNQKAFDALTPAMQQALVTAAADAEKRGWAMSQAAAEASVTELQHNGIQVERVPPDFDADLKRLGERFSREWVNSVGYEATKIFIPYYFER
jgi:TRAP-type C4-dicarboxylate transport system substrate-binding protein